MTTLLPYLKGHCGLTLQQDASVCLEISKILESAALISSGTVGVRCSTTRIVQHNTAQNSTMHALQSYQYYNSISLLSLLSIFGCSFGEVCEDLTAIALKYGPASVSAAISCMSTLAGNASKDCMPLVQLAQKCFFSMAAIARQQLVDNKQLQPSQV